ncbi:hypothetical protein [Streptomyces sp. NBC_01565]|uniref:hypothetical protein n=1 Tax=unclassified Streptomyces TaxID=2593676 RepID=UPI002256EF95|nr:hypothetical protein [Streptomyces sp. NBC_01565]MCX4546804.1 hypothetical protein [Streptomyces sp. NBC_01565]
MARPTKTTGSNTPGSPQDAREAGPPVIPSDKYKLAYDAAIHALAQQDATLTNLRNRTTGLITIAALIGSFSSFFGLGTKDRPLPVWFAVTVISFIALILIGAIYVLWPKGNWSFGPDPSKIIDSEYVDHMLTWGLADGMADSLQDNEKQIRQRGRVYSACVVLLGLEAAFVVAASLASR